MYKNPALPTLHLSNGHGTSGPLPVVHCESDNEGSDSEAGILCGSVDPLSGTSYPRQDPLPPNTSVEPANWETTPAWVSVAINPSSQEALEGVGLSGAALSTYPPYSDPHFGRDLVPIAHEFVSYSYPLGQMANADNGPLGFIEGMECQSALEMTYMNRSPSGPPSAFPDRDGFSSWSGPDHAIPSISDHRDRVSFGLLSNYSGSVSFRKSIESIQDTGETGLESRIYPLPLPVPSSWSRIPQERYSKRKGDRSFLPPQEIIFSVNNIRGFRMRNALGKVFTGLDGRDDPVLENANGPVSCRLLFPGYPINTSCNQIAVKNWKKERAPIRKSKLAYEIAKRVKQYLDALAVIQINPSVDAQWTIGQGYMKFEKMYLVSVAWVSTGSVQPEIWVDDS